MKISPQWLREFIDLRVDDRRLADDLTMAGISVESISGKGESIVFEMEITTNRPDAMNHYGVARECAAIYDVDLKPLDCKLPSPKKKPDFKIEIEDAQGCARYTGRIVRGVKIAPSPPAIQRRLESMDARPIYNAADATNYNLIEMGHPTHAFDMDLLEGGKIIVRRARAGEKLTTLDGVERKLTSEDLVIADANRAVALAGLMGGLDTMITEKTRDVLIEAAWFDPVVIRAMAKRLGMHTDASHRFERGADWGATSLAAARVAKYIMQWAGGEDGGEIDVIARKLDRLPLALRRSEVLRILGQDIAEEEIERILRRLGFGVTPGRASARAAVTAIADEARTPVAVAQQVADFTVALPTWRLDVEREIDLIEEIARIYGYNRFPNTLPAFAGEVVEPPEAARDARLRSTLLALGYHEAVSSTFTSREDAAAFSGANPIEIANPISEEASLLRTSLVPGMLEMLAYNLNRGRADVRLFEAGKIYEGVGERIEEYKHIVIGATGNAMAGGVHQSARPYSFFDLKGDIEVLLEAFEFRSLYFDPNSADYYHSGRSARGVLDGATVARFGQIHPDVAAKRKLRQEVFVAEIFLNRLYQYPLRQVRYQPVPRFPSVDRDFSFLFDEGTTFERIRSTVGALRIAELRSFAPVEIFRGGNVPAGNYSVLLRATFQSAERTLRDDEVATWSAQIIKALEAVGGTLRA